MQIVTYAVARLGGVYVSRGGVFSVWLSLGVAQRLVRSVHMCVRAQAHTHTHTHMLGSRVMLVQVDLQRR